MKWHKKCKPLPYYGGKSGYGKAEWISNLLPWKKESTYVETHGGAGGVLCYRSPVKCEIYNDLDYRLTNWSRVVRDKWKEFGPLVEGTPHSRIEFNWAVETVDNENESDVQRALAFHVLATQSVAQNLNSHSWRRGISFNVGSQGRWRSDRVELLAERFWNVQIECLPAEKLLERLVEESHVVIYVDPPYPTANTEPYNVCEVDVPLLSELLLAQTGHVAISGFRDEWDHLGWERYEKEGIRHARPGEKKKDATVVTEVLWTNYSMQSIRDISNRLI